MVVLVAISAGCGSEPGDAPADVEPTADVSPTEIERLEPDVWIPPPCPAGEVHGVDGVCLAVGVQGCAPIFVDPDTGLCAPAVEDCAPGESLKLSEGCIPVGVLDCHPDFVDPASGACAPEPELCGDGFIPLPRHGCVPLDPPEGCGEGPWGAVEALSGDVHVDATYAGSDSDGSRERPWPLIGQAVGTVQPGGRIVLASGIFEQGVLLTKSISLVGRCASMVTLSGVKTGSAGPTVVEVSGNVKVALSNLEISGPGIGLVAHSGAEVTLERVSLDGNQNMGIAALHPGTIVTATDSLLARTQTQEDGTRGRGAQISGGASFVLERVALVENHEFGFLAAEQGTTITASDIAVIRTLPRPQEKAGWGIQVREGATLTLTRSVITESHALGLVVSGSQTEVSLIESSILRTLPRSEGTMGRAIEIETGAALTLERSSLVENQEVAIALFDPQTTVQLIDSMVASTQAVGAYQMGRGIQVKSGSSLTLDGSSLVDNHDGGIVAFGDGSSVEVIDSVIARTQLGFGGMAGYAIGVQGGASLTVERSALVENHTSGLIAIKSDASIRLVEVFVAHTQPDFEEARGIGVTAQDVTDFVLERSAIIGNRQSGLYMERVQGTVTDTLVSGTHVDPILTYGEGALVIESDVTLDRVIARDNGRVGILFHHSSGSVQRCLVTDNVIGLLAQESSTLTVDDHSVFRDNEQDRVENVELQIPQEEFDIPELESSD